MEHPVEMEMFCFRNKFFYFSGTTIIKEHKKNTRAMADPVLIRIISI